MANFNDTKPSLVDQSVSDKILNSDTSETNVNITTDKLKTDSKTDLMFQYFANENKLVDEDKRTFFNADRTDSATSSSSSSEESTSSKSSTTSNARPHRTVDLNPKGSRFGPSFGDGKSNRERDRTEEEELSKEDIKLKKLELLRKLGELTQQGVKLSQNYSMESDLDAMQYEYDLHKSIRAKQNGIQWMVNMTMYGVWGLEMLNTTFDPFSLKLEGWSSEVNRKVGDYYDVFGELYDKYGGKGKSMPPELKLISLLVASAGIYHIQNSQLSGTKEPINKQMSPELKEQLRKKAQADKLKEMNNQQQEKFKQYMNKQHEDALKKASDINNLNRLKKDYEIQKEITEKQNELNNLRQQLSDGSVYEQSHYSQPIPQQVNANVIKPVAMPQGMLNNFERQRQQQINQQKQMMIQKEMDETKSNGTHVSLSPKLQSILMSNDSSSSGSFIDNLQNGNNNKVMKKRGRPKKITVNT